MVKHIIGLQLTYTLCVHTVPCPLCGTRSSRRSLESIAAVTRERHNTVNHVTATMLAAMKWRIQTTAVYFCNIHECYATAVLSGV